MDYHLLDTGLHDIHNIFTTVSSHCCEHRILPVSLSLV